MIKLKRWFPFLLLILIITLSLIYLFFGENQSEYIPRTDDPAVIYKEACLHCHGDHGQGSGIIYPALNAGMDEKEIIGAISNGSMLMPAFIHIKSDTLNALVKYINTGVYKK